MDKRKIEKQEIIWKVESRFGRGRRAAWSNVVSA